MACTKCVYRSILCVDLFVRRLVAVAVAPPALGGAAVGLGIANDVRHVRAALGNILHGRMALGVGHLETLFANRVDVWRTTVPSNRRSVSRPAAA